MPDGAGYDQDFFLWSHNQAELLRDMPREGKNAGIDWENVAEEIVSLGRRDRRELGSYLVTTLEHLLKLAFSPASEPRSRWAHTVSRSRRAVAAILEDSPSLRSTVPGVVAGISDGVRRDVARTMTSYDEQKAAVGVRLGLRLDIETRVLDEEFFPHPDDPIEG